MAATHSTNSAVRTKADERAVDEGCFYDPTGPDKVCKFVETFCTLQDGERKGEPVKFLDWIIRDIVKPLYGWKRPDHTRRFRRGSCWTPRKQTKTTTLSALALYELISEPGAQVYCVSSTIETAGHLYRIAADMVDNNETLSAALWPRSNIKTIEARKSNSFLKVLSGDKTGKSGHNASCTLWDELAEIKDPEAWYRLYDSGMARRQPIWFSISTPQYERNSLAWEQYCKAKAILNGKDLDTEYLAVVHGVPDGVDYRVPENWWPYIPSLGETVSKDYYLRQWETAKDNPREVCRFRNLLLAQWTESIEAFLQIGDIEKCTHEIDERDYYGKRCFVGADGGKNHLAAYVLYFPHDHTVIPRFFIPKSTAERSDARVKTQYVAWSESKHVTATPGDMMEWPVISQSLIKDSEKFSFIEVGYDPTGMDSRMAEVQPLLRCPVTAVENPPSVQAPPTKLLEELVGRHEMRFANNPCLIDNAKNAAVSERGEGRIMLDREKASGRYDGIAALICALQRCQARGTAQSIYNQRGAIYF